MTDSFFKILFSPLAVKIISLSFGILLIWIIIKITRIRLFSKIKNIDNRYHANKISGFIGFLLSLLLMLIVFSDKLSGATIAFGVAGAGIALALQEVIVSFAGWVAIMFGNFYKSGDRIQMAGVTGDVMDIGVLRTTIMETGQWVEGDLYNGRIVLVANSFVLKEPVYNYSGEFPFLWDEIKIPISTDSDFEFAREMLLNIGKEVATDLSYQSKEKWKKLQYKYRLEDAQSEPMVSLSANESRIELILRYVVNYKRRRTTKTELFTRVLNEIAASKGAVKLATASIQIINKSA